MTPHEQNAISMTHLSESTSLRNAFDFRFVFSLPSLQKM